MLPVNQMTPLIPLEASLKRFKAWWESVIDWLCFSLIFIAVVAWSLILEGEASGVICIQKAAKNETFWNSVYAKYCSRRCALELFKGILVYYPYVVSAQGIILIFCQIFWLKIPQVSSKMEAVDMIVEAVEKMSSEAERKKDMILAKLQLGFLLKEKTTIPIVSCLFIVKSALICLISGISFGLIIGFWFNSLELWNNRNVECRLSTVKEAQYCPTVSCNIGAGRHTFVIVCINLVILALLFFLSIFGLLYLFCCKVRGVKKKLPASDKREPLTAESPASDEREPLTAESPASDDRKPLKYKAYQNNDLCFILGLLDSNLHDGGFLTGKIKELVKDVEELISGSLRSPPDQVKLQDAESSRATVESLQSSDRSPEIDNPSGRSLNKTDSTSGQLDGHAVQLHPISPRSRQTKSQLSQKVPEISFSATQISHPEGEEPGPSTN